MLDKVLRSKEDVEVHVLKCSNGTQLYVPGDGPPAFFDDGFGGVYPTLFTLWKLPAVMPELVTHGPVSKFLLPKERSAGADMMLPGVIVPDEGLGSFAEGQKRCIRVQGNDAPFAVGKMCVRALLCPPWQCTVSSTVGLYPGLRATPLQESLRPRHHQGRHEREGNGRAARLP